MKYRNDSDQSLTIWDDPVVLVGPGETYESDEHVTGLVLVDDDGPVDAPAPPTADAPDPGDADPAPVDDVDGADPADAPAPADDDETPEVQP